MSNLERMVNVLHNIRVFSKRISSNIKHNKIERLILHLRTSEHHLWHLSRHLDRVSWRFFVKHRRSHLRCCRKRLP